MNLIRSLLSIATAAVALSSVAAGEPPVSDLQEQRTCDFGKMSMDQAKRLDGKRIRVRTQFIETCAASAGRVYYRCKGEDNVARWVYFPEFKAISKDQFIRKAIVVEGILWVCSGGQTLQTVGEFAPPIQFSLLDSRIVD